MLALNDISLKLDRLIITQDSETSKMYRIADGEHIKTLEVYLAMHTCTLFFYSNSNNNNLIHVINN